MPDETLKPEATAPSELEDYILELLRSDDCTRRASIHTFYFPLAEAWLVHFDIQKKKGIIKQYGGVKNYAKEKFGCSYELIRKSAKAYEYRRVIDDAIRWLDDGCHGFDTHKFWNGWKPTKVYTPEWVCEVGEAYHNRQEPPPAAPSEKVDKEGDDEDQDEDEHNELAGAIAPIAQALKKELDQRLTEIVSLDQQLADARKRVAQLEAILIEHQIAVPEAELSDELKEWIEGQIEEPTTALVLTRPSRYTGIQAHVWRKPLGTPSVIVLGYGRPKSKRGGARPGAGRKKRSLQQKTNRFTVVQMLNNEAKWISPEDQWPDVPQFEFHAETYDEAIALVRGVLTMQKFEQEPDFVRDIERSGHPWLWHHDEEDVHWLIYDTELVRK